MSYENEGDTAPAGHDPEREEHLTRRFVIVERPKRRGRRICGENERGRLVERGGGGGCGETEGGDHRE